MEKELEILKTNVQDFVQTLETFTKNSAQASHTKVILDAIIGSDKFLTLKNLTGLL